MFEVGGQHKTKIYIKCQQCLEFSLFFWGKFVFDQVKKYRNHDLQTKSNLNSHATVVHDKALFQVNQWMSKTTGAGSPCMKQHTMGMLTAWNSFFNKVYACHNSTLINRPLQQKHSTKQTDKLYWYMFYFSRKSDVLKLIKIICPSVFQSVTGL